MTGFSDIIKGAGTCVLIGASALIQFGWAVWPDIGMFSDVAMLVVFATIGCHEVVRAKWIERAAKERATKYD